MKNSEYWKQRFAQMEEAQNKKGEEAVLEIQKQYRKAQKELEGKINTWYQRFADNNNITLAEARKMLSSSDLKELKWDIKEYIKYGKEHALTGGWEKELENASARFHISKYEALKIQTQQSLEVLFAKQFEIVTDTMEAAYKDVFFHTAYEIQNGIGIGWDIAGIDQSQVEKVMLKPWAVDGKNFSERIWGNKEKLISEIHTELTQNILLGADPQKAIDNIAKKMNVSKQNAGRLVMPEEAYFSSAAQRDCFLELGVEEYEIVATLDSHTSEICRTLDGQHFPMKDYQAGVTAPPFHVYCRSTTVPYFEDDYGVVGERAARDEDGKTYYIPADMNYQEWKDSFVENDVDEKKTVSKIKNVSDVVTRNRPPVSLQDLKTDYKDSIMKAVNSAPLQFQRVILENQDKIAFAKTNAIGKQKYSSKYGIFVNLSKDYKNSRGQWTTLFHEIGHRIDKIYGKPSGRISFINALKNDFKTFTNGYAKIYNITVEEAYQDLSKDLKNGTDEESHILSDLFGALSGGKCRGRYGHRIEYWKSDVIIGNEAFAHFFSASAINNNRKLESIQAVFPNAYEEFLKIVGEMK